MIYETTQFHSLTTHTMWKIRRARYTTHRQSLKNYYYALMNYDHHTHRLSLTQVAPGHVNEILAMDMERVKPENPELKKILMYLFSNGLMFFQFNICLLHFKLYIFILEM